MKVTEAGLVANPLYLSELSGYDSDLLCCRETDVRLTSRMTSFNWRSDGKLEIGGHAYIPSVDPIAGNLSISASLINYVTAENVPLPVERHVDSAIDWESNDHWTSYAASGFTTLIDPAVVLGNEDSAVDLPNWHLVLTVSAGGVIREAPLTRRDLNGATGHLAVGPMVGTSRVAIEMRSATTGLTLIPVSPHYVATAVELSGRSLTLTVEAHFAPAAAKISLECLKLGIRKSATCLYVDGTTATYTFEVPSLAAMLTRLPSTNGSCASTADSGARSLSLGSRARSELATESDQTRSLRLGITGYGFLILQERRTRVIATSVQVSADKRILRIEGTADLPVIHAPRIVLSSGKAVIPATNVELNVRTNEGSNDFAAEFLLPATPGMATKCSRKWVPTAFNLFRQK